MNWTWEPGECQILFGLLYSAIFLLGVAGNLAVILVTLHQTSLQTVQNLFMLNLSVADLVVCLLSVPITPISNIYKQWLFGRVLCHLIPWIQGTSIFIQTFSLTGIAVNRYTVILHPHLPPLSRTLSLCLILAIWLISSALTVPYGYNMKIVRFEELCGEFCDEAWGSEAVRGAYSISVFAAQFLLPASIMSYAYGTILLHLRKRTNLRIHSMHKDSAVTGPLDVSRPVTPMGEEQRLYYQKQRERLVSRKRRTTIILICMVFIFIGAWLPYQAVNLLIEIDTKVFVVGGPDDHMDLLYLVMTLTHAFAMLSVLANPILYAWLNLAFRQTILKALRPRPAHSPYSKTQDNDHGLQETRSARSELPCTRPPSHPPLSSYSPCPCQKCAALPSMRPSPSPSGRWSLVGRLRRSGTVSGAGSSALLSARPSPPSIFIEHFL